MITAPEEMSQRTWALTCPPNSCRTSLRQFAFHSVDGQHVRDKGGIQLDGKARRQIDSEMIVRDQQNAVGRQNAHQRLPDEFGVGIGEGFVGDFPNLAVRRSGANCTQYRDPIPIR